MKTYTGINIQYPISQLIFHGKKIVETRTYPLPEKYINEYMVLVETPGKTGKFKSRGIALIKFGSSFPYMSKEEFYKDTQRHCVTRTSPWAWKKDKPKWGWPILEVVKLPKSKVIIKRLGIQYTKGISI